MLSILIPTYNQNIIKLVNELHRQSAEQFVNFEIIVLEDGSTQFIEGNKKVNDLEFGKQIVLSHNIGRSAVRNKLAKLSKYQHLLFIDCDAEVCSPYYIERYLSFCNQECIVIGGTAYSENETNPNYSLRLKYGRIREARSAQDRGKNNFATFNFLISKNIFNRIQFDESIRGYGHEDMLFGHQLHILGYEFIQIENTLVHKGLDDNTTFLSKTEEATRNLFLLFKTGKYTFLQNESKLLYSLTIIQKLGLTKVCAFKFDLLKSLLRKLLRTSSPSLLLYDLYKILFLCKTSLQK